VSSKRRERRIRERQCSGKQRYETESDAASAARRWRRTGEAAMSWYRCRWCACWHVGHAHGASAVTRLLAQ
jgi:hypothetical protein